MNQNKTQPLVEMNKMTVPALLTEIEVTLIKSGTDILVPSRINYNVLFGDSLTLHVAPPSGQHFYWSHILDYV